MLGLQWRPRHALMRPTAVLPQMWNEPDLHTKPLDYAAFVINTTNVVLAAQKHARIYVQIAGNTPFLNETLIYIQQHAPHLLDSMAVTYHPYSYNPDASVSRRGVGGALLPVAACKPLTWAPPLLGRLAILGLPLILLHTDPHCPLL